MDENNGVIKEEVLRSVANLLSELATKHSLEPLKDLFWTALNYDRVSQPISSFDWPSAVADMLFEDPVLFATAADGAFPVIYVRLAKNELPLGEERRVISWLLGKYVDALFIFSNSTQNLWHFVNIKPDEPQTRRRLFRRITVGPEERLRTAAERLSLLDLSSLRKGASRLDVIALHEEAFDVEMVTKTFFDYYKDLFKILQADLKLQTGDAVWAHDYALQFLNRCMFLYFIQRKGWLGNDKEFLRTFWKSYHESIHDSDTFFEQWLKVLFLEAFNDKFQYGVHRHFPEHIYTILAKAPYLNGGLFTPNRLDSAYPEVIISDIRFEQIFLFLQSYNFTIAEDSPLDQEVAVDPEMIGKVYESLVNVSTEIDERGDAGIFYTPRTEIDLMCRLTVVDYLANHLGQDKKDALYDAVFALEAEEKSEADDHLAILDLWRPINDVLQAVTVVDPACGSGSFLVGMLYVLDDLQQRTNERLYVDEDAYTRKKRLIGQNLYGVDVMEWAAHIAELRLWLTLIVDANFRHLEDLHVRKDPLLPHLSFKVRFGDSLVQEVGGINLGQMQTVKNLPAHLTIELNKLKKNKLDFYHNLRKRPSRKKEDLEKDELEFFRKVLDYQIHNKQEEKKRLQRQMAQPAEQQLRMVEIEPVSQKNEPTVEQLKRVAELEGELNNLKRARNALTTPKDVPFLWDIAFVEVFAREKSGFDIVIGNPPYVRQESIADPRLPRDEALTKEQKQLYKAKLARAVYQVFPDFFGYKYKDGKETVSHKIDARSDLYVYFYLYGLKLLNSQGSFSFITSNSWLDVGYGVGLQEFLLNYCHVKLIIDNQVRRSFASAAVNTTIVLFSAPSSQVTHMDDIVHFVMFTSTFESALEASIFKQIERTTQRTTTQMYRLNPIQQRTLLAVGMDISIEDAKQEVTSSGKGNVSALVKEVKASYKGDKWGGKYLRAPDIYWSILEKGKNKLVRLGKVAEVKRGITTGVNKFFFLDSKSVNRWGIEDRFLSPILQSPRDCKSLMIDPKNLKAKIFMCHKSKEELRGTGALKYIQWGETQGFNTGPTCAGRVRWWDLGQRQIPYLGFNYLVDTTARTLYAADGCYFSDNFQEINISQSDTAALCASLNSTLFQLMVNVAGRANFGGGLLKIQTYEVSELLCVHPQAIDFADSSIFTATAWNVLTPSPERKALDAIVFDSLNLTQGEQDGVYEAVIDLVQRRLSKSNSLNDLGNREVKGVKELRKRMDAVNQTLGIWMGVPEVIEEEVDNSYA